MNSIIEAEDVKQGFYSPSTFSKSNYLIQARYNYTLLCNQLLALALLKAKKEDNVYTASFSVMETRELLNKNYKEFYNQIKTSADKMTETKICMENPKTGEFGYYQLIPTFTCKDGECQVTFNPDLNHLIGDLTSNFVQLDYKRLARLDSVNSFRLYETLKSKAYYPKNYKGNKSGKYILAFSLAELKVMFNAIDINRKEIKKLFDKKESPDYDAIMQAAQELYEAEKDMDIPTADKYKAPKWKNWQDFKDRCIEASLEQINEKTELYVEYEAIKINKSVKTINFFVTDKNYADLEEDKKEEDDLFDLIDKVFEIIEERISVKDVTAILTAADNNLEKIKNAYNIAKQKDRDDIVGFLISAIKREFKEPVKSKGKKKNSFEFSDQREYDFEELEKVLMNR